MKLDEIDNGLIQFEVNQKEFEYIFKQAMDNNEEKEQNLNVNDYDYISFSKNSIHIETSESKTGMTIFTGFILAFFFFAGYGFFKFFFG